MLQFGIPKPKRAGRPHSRVPKGISWSCPLPVLGGSLDALDVRLFRDLLQSPASSPMGAHFRTSFGAIAKKVGAMRRPFGTAFDDFIRMASSAVGAP